MNINLLSIYPKTLHYAFASPQYVQGDSLFRDQTPADHNDFPGRNPLGVIKTVYFYEQNTVGMRLGVRRIAVGLRRVGHPDAKNKILSNVLCDTSGSSGVVEWGLDRGEAACTSVLPSPSVEASGFYSNVLYIDSLVTSQSWIANADSADINVWPFSQ
ncbi:MAG: hypothetical protein FJY95_20460 [Candidatus Handelsmanbacteria bacterium]|nr:hypothetical protein [Candidatus Handelsmanbacteria bacterium]